MKGAFAPFLKEFMSTIRGSETKKTHAVQDVTNKKVGSKVALDTVDEIKGGLRLYSTLQVVVTAVNASTAVKLDTPENTGNFTISHIEASGTIYLGDENVTGATDGYPLKENTAYELKNMKKGNNNDIYAIGSGTFNVYIVGRI